MVRLKDCRGRGERLLLPSFQFQNGAIKRRGDTEHVLSDAHVSIPKWCD